MCDGLEREGRETKICSVKDEDNKKKKKKRNGRITERFPALRCSFSSFFPFAPKTRIPKRCRLLCLRRKNPVTCIQTVGGFLRAGNVDLITEELL